LWSLLSSLAWALDLSVLPLFLFSLGMFDALVAIKAAGQAEGVLHLVGD
jgi:hypothetical protein